MSQSVARAIQLLELVSAQPRTQSELAEALGVHRSTALRLLETLSASGLVRRSERGRYHAGYRLAGLAAQASDQFDLPDLARPSLRALSEQTTHTVHLASLERDHIVYADKIEPPRSIRLYSQVGARVSLHTAGVSKAILAYRPEEFVTSLFADYQFERHTDTTITSFADFEQELVGVRERGWAIDDGELEDYVNCLAMPVRNYAGEVTAAVSITALKARADRAALEELLPDLHRTVDTISAHLGWKP